MAWDSNTARRRGNSNARATPRASVKSQDVVTNEVTTPKSVHVTDPALQSFLSPSFDAADYLNATLPSLRATGSSQRPTDEVPLAEVSTQTQTLLSHLSAHTSRLTTTLTQLTDEILRSGSRLAYEVEILRGETLGLSEALTEGLQDDIARFVAGGLESHLAQKPPHPDPAHTRGRSSTIVATKEAGADAITEEKDPAYVAQLRTLSTVRARLDTVIQTFGDAMSWTFPPSEVSVTSSFVSVSAPEPGSEAHSMEERGQQVSKKYRDEITDLLVGTPDQIEGIEAAARRVEELKELAQVWKGTAEEKARIKFVEALAKMVEDKHRDLLREAETSGRNERLGDGTRPGAAASEEEKSHSSYGFISQLQKMRGGF
ncbi:MAG: hypothetical protein M1818_000705 [Claussenomyces sp. TS43310]|nr:MAG: hypothetical protein M1818_000705 [Claussenomyces sp. TS43310]